MSRFPALFATLVAALTALLDRARVRRYRRQRLPTVREALAAKALPPAPRLARPLSTKPLGAAEGSPDYLSLPSSTGLLRGVEPRLFRVASVRILPAPPRELAILQLACFGAATRREARARTSPPLRPGELSVRTPTLAALPAAPRTAARPAYFGLDEALASVRAERAFPPPKLLAALQGRRPPVVPAPRPAPRAPLHVLDPERFGLGPDATPATELDPVEPRHPPRLPRARANFHARYAEPHRSELLIPAIGTFYGERLATRLQPLFEKASIGAVEIVNEWELEDELGKQQEEVREQFTLRRDIDRASWEDDFGPMEWFPGDFIVAIKTFTGLEFVDLDPEPFRQLQMRLEAPPVDTAPLTESAEAQLKWLFSAVREHPAEPPVPVLPK